MAGDKASLSLEIRQDTPEGRDYTRLVARASARARCWRALPTKAKETAQNVSFGRRLGLGRNVDTPRNAGNPDRLGRHPAMNRISRCLGFNACFLSRAAAFCGVDVNTVQIR